ncbi:MAG TPA: 3'-5' exonuclease, partial [Verrucomicrobiae bacterium]
DDQSIYGWRGAEIANLLNLEQHFPEVKVIKLEQNYRSTSTILNAANAIIKNNLRRRGKTLWSGKGTGTKIQLNTYTSDEEEAREVVGQIEFKRLAHRIPWQDCAILFRTNMQSRPIETELRRAGVRYHLIGGQSFFDRREIKDFLAYVKMFINPNDDISLLRIANVPARGLSDVTMERLLGASHERKCSVFTAMKNPLVTTEFQKQTRESIEAFVAFIEEVQGQLLRPAPDMRLQTWAENFLNEVNYFGELKRLEKDPEAAESRIRNLREMMAEMDGVGNEPMERLNTFLEGVSLDSDREEDKENTQDAVTLITMHSCKGLEYPHVWIVGLEDGLLPHARSKVENSLDEERRLFYVAITRAMETLAISHCTGRKKYGQSLPCHPSQFLKELPPDLLERSDAKSRAPVNHDSGKSLFAAMRASIS